MIVMKKVMLNIFLIITLVSCDFLDNPPATGLSDDKLIDLPAIRALVNGAYDECRVVMSNVYCMDIALVRDMKVRNRPERDGFFEHQMFYDIEFSRSYKILGLLNEVATHDVQGMEGNSVDKSGVLGDMHFMRAFIYFVINTHYELPSTGYSAPLVLKPVMVGERFSCAKADDIRKQIEQDIEAARTYLKETQNGQASYFAATALAARIYFYHEKYALAYACADELIKSGKYGMEEVAAPFIPLGQSKENIFSLLYNSLDLQSPVTDLFTCLQASDVKGSLILYEKGELAQFFHSEDNRYKHFFVAKDNVVYGSGKYTTDKMNLPCIRLAEMHLTRAEANIMNLNRVSQQDVNDLNEIIGRAMPASIVTVIPSKNDMLDLLYNERTKELALEIGDHFLNVKRLKKGIAKIPTEGEGYKSYTVYADQVVSIFPLQEELFHNLNRKP